MADEDSKRPSFTQFWKRSKEQSTTKNITFIQSGPPLQTGSPSKDSADHASGSGDVSPTQAAKDKAQARRAQVRRAQIQHRQRKANYIKQLELDVAKIREMITEADRESKNLRHENATIRDQLTVLTASKPSSGTGLGKQPSVSPTASTFLSSQGSPDAGDVFGSETGLPLSAATASFFSDPGLDDITMTLQLDDAMNYPCLQFTRNSSPSSGGWDTSSPPQADSPPQAVPGGPALTGIPGIDLTPEQTDQAINFILALEHVCWGHFHAADFQPDTTLPSGKASAHTLMASAIALSTAPQQVFKQLGKSQRNVWFTPSALHSNPISGEISWKSSGLSLHSLYGLATSLNPGDKEITPVQAWFELAESFDVGILLDPIVLENLKRELHGVVKCLHFGAAMERRAFESVVGRVVGAALGVDTSDVLVEGGFGNHSVDGGFEDPFALAGPAMDHVVQGESERVL